MRILLTLLTCCSFYFNCAAQQDITFSFEPDNDGYIIYAGNKLLCPATVLLDLSLKNMSFSKMTNEFVVPAKAERFLIGEIRRISPANGYGYSYKYNFMQGNAEMKRYDTSYAYDLPYRQGKEIRLFQGYNGQFSHQNENALDFTMPEGSEVLAARDGLVIKVVKNNTEGCGSRECAKFNNYITVYHTDGTFADYIHLKYDGAKVKEGDTVKKGDVIGYSGNTGWSSGPHLHFMCYIPDSNLRQRKTISTIFRVGDGTTAAALKEGQVYVRGY